MELEKNAKADEIIRLLKENEIAMHDLYLEFAEQFSFYGSFWQDIAKEEKSHAAWIETLYRGTEAELEQFAERRFPTEAIRKNIQLMAKLKESAAAGKMTLLESLEKAVHLENGMLENKFFEVFSSDAPVVQVLLEALRMGTKEHFAEISNIWKKENMGGEFERETV